MEPNIEPTVKRPKGLLVTTWIVSILSFLILSPILFISAVFSSDNSSGATSLMSYIFLILPIVYLAGPIVTHVLYKKERVRATRISAYAVLLICLASFGYLVSIFLSA